MSLSIKHTPFYRYTYNTQFSFHLLESYIHNIEEQIKSSKENYKEKKETIVIEEYPEMGFAQVIDIHNGLDSQTFNLDEIFLDHFPNIQRKSALLTIYSFFEYELILLCNLFTKTENFSLKLDDINGKGIISKAILYLEKVAGIKIKSWQKIHEIRIIRNLVVHGEGRLLDSEGKKVKEVKIIKTSKLLSCDTELKIEEGYLQYILKTFQEQFELIDKEIKLKYPDK
jgi:hypothetical protein